jgi:outer membrane lipoprotein SlyB
MQTESPLNEGEISMNTIKSISLPVLSALAAVGCATAPTGPSVLVLPGVNKTFEQFRADDMQCRQYASTQTGGVTPAQTATRSGVGTAVAGTAVGAAAGAALGGGEGAAIGAGTGLLAGSVAGSGTARATGYEAQQRYDMSYIQCMYAYGNRVPVSGNFVDEYPDDGPAESGVLYPPPPGTQAPVSPPR